MKKVSSDIIYAILLLAIVFTAIFATYAHHGSLLIDTGREAYYPTQVLLGKVLYKDIFNIYGPFSYLFNAVLFKIFGANLNVLYITGCVGAVLVTGLIYLIAKRFLTSFLSFSIAVITVMTGVVTHYLSNFVFPYSFAMLYGLISFLFSVLFLLKYEAEKNNKYLYLSSLFAGLSVANKYEFMPYIIAILYAIIRVKPLAAKQIATAIVYLLSFPVLCFGILFLQGLNIHDILNTIYIYNKMAHSQTLKYFYHLQGVYFSPKIMKVEIIAMSETLLALLCFWTALNIKNVFASFLMVIIASLLVIFLTGPLSYSLIPIMILILAVLDFKNLKDNKALQILVISALCFSIKAFWGLMIFNYGVFFIGFLLLAAMAIISDLLKDKNINYKGAALYFILSAVVLCWHNQQSIKTIPVKTEKGTIFAETNMAKASIELIDYINKNTKKTDTIVILPEGAMINFFTQRPTDNYYTSLIPLYVETFGEENIVNHFKKTKPQYIVFNNWNTSEYYFRGICQDYALSFCSYVAKNYKEEKAIGDNFKYLIFKLK